MSPSRHRLIDRIGASGSLLCAIHCALLPLLLAVLPSLGVGARLNDGFELAFVAFATGLGIFSLVVGYRRHGSVRALSLLVPGLLALWAGLVVQPVHGTLVLHALVMTFGGTLVGLAHLANLRLNHGHVHDATCTH